jgi:hypothetical protein
MHIPRHTARLLVIALSVACGDAPPEEEEVSTTETGEADVSGGTELVGESSSSGEPDTGSSSMAVADTSSESGSGGEIPPCELPAGSPPPVVVDAATLVPIDAIAVEAVLRFDIATSLTSGHAELTFSTGPEDGFPIFDLRQDITELDGVELTADAAPFVSPNGDVESRLRALTEELPACSLHTLVIDYEVWRPDAENALEPLWVVGGVKWHSFHSDGHSGRFLEQWAPANLPHDEVSISFDIEVVGDPPHMVASNGTVTPIADNQWRVEFPPSFTAMSPLIVLMPEALVEVTSTPVRLPDGDVVTLEVVKDVEVLEPMVDLVAATSEALIALFATHNANFMEYEGATTAMSYAIPHEVFHSWIGRGVRPLMHRDAWFDEAWTMFSIEHEFMGEPLDASDDPEVMAPDDAWIRRTEGPAYTTGSRILATLAAEIGTDELRGLLREFYVAHAGELVTTEQLEAHFVAAIPSDTPGWLFHRFVYGHER